MPENIILPFLIIILIVTPAAADILQPGTKGVDFCIEINNTGAFPDYVFIAYPLTMSGQYAVMGPGDCVSFYKFASPSFYAVKREAFNETAAGSGDYASHTSIPADAAAIIPSGISIFSGGTVAENSPITGISTIYTITSVNVTHLGIIPSRDRFTYADGRTEEKPFQQEETTPAPSAVDPVTVMLTIAAGSAIALIVGMRAQKR